jgi:mannitol 2-dehydrogenase
MAPISLDRVTKVYPNGFRALEELSLDVHDGEFMVLVGPSGCGKTTALRIVAGLEKITGGTVRIGERVVNNVEPKERDIAMVFQNYALYPSMKVRENIGFGLKLRKLPKPQIEQRVGEAAHLLGLTEWLDRKPSQLSGGQRQRVAMGRAIVREPSVFLMDEPLSNLDAKLRVKMRAEVSRIQRRLGVATLYVTHDQVEAMTMGDRVAVLSSGVLQQCDAPQVIYDHPRNLFVAGFMGSPPMNLFEGRMDAAGGSVHIGSQSIAIPPGLLDGNPGLRAYTGARVVVGVRPEHLRLGNGRGATEADGCGFEGVVELIEALGSELLVHFTTDATAVEVSDAQEDDAEGLSHGTIAQSGEGVARLELETPVRIGERLRFAIDPHRLRFFDPATTEAVDAAVPAASGGGARRPELGRSAAPGATGGAVVDLNEAGLARLTSKVPTPSYDRAGLTAGIVHLGVGSFHRAHQAMYIDRLLNAGTARTWAICGVGVLPADRPVADALGAQDELYTLVLKHADGHYEPRVIGSIVDYLFAPDDAEAVIRRIADPATKIVTLTITEGGYAIDDTTGRFNRSAPGVAEDLVAGATPRSVFGLVTAALARRRSAGLGPLTLLSCDNLPGNGSLAREAFVSFATLRDAQLASWIEREVSFPNSMVDRITPATTDADREQVAARFGLRDRWPVVCEPFTQWVLEDRFSAGRPPLEDAGVQIVEDVAPYELMKLRLLNASHQALGYFGRLCDYTFVHEAARDELFRAFLRGYMDDEAIPTLDPVPGVDLTHYKETLIDRFSNPEIRDTLARLCAESSDRIPKWVVPVIRAELERGGPVALSAAIVASWARYAEGVDEQGRPIEIVDRRKDEVMERAARQVDDPTAFLESRELFGDLADDERFVDAYLTALRSLHERGARATLEGLVERPV